MLSLRRIVALTVLALVALPLLGTATAAAIGIDGDPLDVFVSDVGQLQARRAGEANGIFFPSFDDNGDAGFFIAVPVEGTNPSAIDGEVWGFNGSAGPGGISSFTPVSQDPVSGSGSAADPLTQVTTYKLFDPSIDYMLIKQTTTYVNGSQEFNVKWEVTNTSGFNLNYRAIAAADFFFEGSDQGTGIFTEGPPRFIGGTNADTGSSGGFIEVLNGSPAWTAYQALAFGGGPNEVWGKVEGAADSATGTVFDNSVLGESVDNAGAVEWDDRLAAVLSNGSTATYSLTIRSAVPSALQLNPTNAGSPQKVPINITATAVDTNGTPYAGKTLRFNSTGANVFNGSTVLNNAGSGTITDPGTNAGGDTIVAFVDFNNNGTREGAEPQASALATFLDNIRPTCGVKVTGDRPGGTGGAGKPLVITVTCGEQVTVLTSVTLTPPRNSANASARKRKRKVRKIKLKSVTTTLAGGNGTVKVTLPKSIRRKYAGKTLTAAITLKATDGAKNVTTVKTTKKIKILKAKKKKRRRR